MMGSGVLEWVRETLYAGADGRAGTYETMIEEASRLNPGSGGVMMVPSFVPDAGPTKKHGTRGTVVGLGLASTRGHVYRAALEGLAFQLKDALRILTAATGFEPAGIRVVGGGSRNALWNQIRADACGLPVSVTGHKEATVLGAAIAAWVGAGRFGSLEEGQRSLVTEASVVEPSADAGAYSELFERYALLAPALKGFYLT
jgi:L-fuculokinase